MKSQDLTFHCTSSRSPEQYDIVFAEQTIGYLHYRWGIFEITLFLSGEEVTIFSAKMGGEYDGAFRAKERHAVFRDAKTKIIDYIAANKVQIIARSFEAEGNGKSYLPKRRPSPLKGKRILFLGSSIFSGEESRGISLPDYLDKTTGSSSKTLLLQGGDLFAERNDSYLRAIQHCSSHETYDALIVAFTGWDYLASLPFLPGKGKRKSLKEVLEILVEKAAELYACPVYFLSWPFPENEAYLQQVLFLRAWAKDASVSLIDGFLGESQALTKEKRSLYFAPYFHATLAGYRDFYLPKIEQALLGDKKKGIS
jgi:hypothetical protein